MYIFVRFYHDKYHIFFHNYNKKINKKFLNERFSKHCIKELQSHG